MRVGIDVDGVLANFTKGYAQIIRSVSGRDLLTEEDIRRPKTWAWDRDAGYTAAEESAAWESIKQSDLFWEALDALPGADDFLTDLFIRYDNDQIDEIYFITTRLGIGPQRQTAAWLWEHGADKPNVLIAQTSAQKGHLAWALNLTHFIDDKPSNCEAVKNAVPTCQVFVLDYPYNQTVNADVTRVTALAQFKDALFR